VLHHNLWHHLHYQDQTKDESAWKSPKWKKYGAFMYTWVVSITAYYRSWVVGKKHRKIQKYFLAMCFIQLILLSILIFLKPLQWTLIFLVPMITGLIITVYTTYHHHSWLESDDPYKSSYNIITPWYNLVTGNLGYHIAHHLKWSLHWSKLPEFHKSIEHKIAPEFYKKYNILWYSKGK
jgi:fatty acid desaturase